MSRVLLESGIVVLLVLIGISIFIPSGNESVDNIIVDFENSIESGEVIDDGEISDIEVSVEDESNFISKLNSKIANAVVNGLNSILDLGIRFLRKVIN